VLFKKSEFIERMNDTKARMQDLEIEVLLITNPANINYLSGYDGYSFYAIQGLLVQLNREEPIWIGRGIDANGARLTTWMQEENIKAYNDDYVQSSTKHPMNFFADVLVELGCNKKRIGIEMNQEFFSHRCYIELERDLPDAVFTDASYLVNKIRMVKSEKEIEYMKVAGKITTKAMQTAINQIEVGVREADVAANVYHHLISGVDGLAGDYPAIIPLMPSGERTSTPHLSWSDKKYKMDEVVLLELSGCRNRYHAPLARTVFTGSPSKRYKELSEIVTEGLHVILDFIRPGVLCEEVELKWRKFIEKTGLVKDSRIGYPIGLGYPPDWGEQTLSLRQGDRTVLVPNMTIHVLPAIWLGQYGFEISESIRVTDDGCETFSDVPRKLFLK